MLPQLHLLCAGPKSGASSQSEALRHVRITREKVQACNATAAVSFPTSALFGNAFESESLESEFFIKAEDWKYLCKKDLTAIEVDTLLDNGIKLFFKKAPSFQIDFVMPEFWRYPDLNSVWPSETRDVAELSLNALMLADVAKVLEVEAVRILFNGVNRPMRIYPAYGESKGEAILLPTLKL